MFKCKVCSEKDKRLADLQAHIDLLTKWVMQPHKEVLPEQHEADAILSATQHIIDISDNPENHETPLSQYPLSVQEIENERERIMNGTY